ncbi:hypothetical protein CONLIGDRAFT_676219 [Coniochaeta ligniaria NRRL 30616]|uniref:Uncharacterized protein n=1 Tax=Coniochaeta ligniaria NRRL 30616 TaxID=1408157 RepID=A0A1J7J576_9PEZI|nr:hypothetical protein CONLIGDRAFT_676219 [Coniochaeta ligniaria NRRL 30616]
MATSIDSISLYSFASFGWLTLQAIPLALWPTFVMSLLTPDFKQGNGPSEAVTPFTNAAVLISTLYHAAFAFNAYGTYTVTSQAGYALGAGGSAVLAALGLWNVMFGGDKGHISKRNGADKRTSGFPFKNAEADKRPTGRKDL